MPILLSRRHFLCSSAALAAGLSFRPAWANGNRPALPVPPLIDGSSGAPINLTIQRGEWSFLPGLMTQTLGINQDYLAPTLRTRRNSELNLAYHNTLSEGVAIHGHGLHVPGIVDGGPQLEMPPGERWTPALSIQQPAATCWYHSHTHGKSGAQTYRGLAGMIIIDDDETDAADLPNQYGIDDLPIIIQDRTFDADGSLIYSLQDASEDGWYGETAIINGAIEPVAQVPAGKIRLRILNGANARFHILTFADNRVFQKIACDGGLMEKPVPLTTMEMSPGERCEIIVDLSDGGPADLLTYFEDEVDVGGEGLISGVLNLFSQPAMPDPASVLTLQPDAHLAANQATLPERLATISRPDPREITRTRTFELTMEHNGEHDHSAGHASMDMAINGAAMDMSVINERVPLGVWERWRIRSDQGAHPFHAHGCSFLIEQMEDGELPEDQTGWKDTVVLDDDGWSEIVVKFNHVATEQHPYMYHCHILEHEDRGMMGQFTVT